MKGVDGAGIILDYMDTMRTQHKALMVACERLIAIVKSREWQPIETAPKDDKDILLYANGVIVVGCYEHRYWGLEYGSCMVEDDEIFKREVERIYEAGRQSALKPIPLKDKFTQGLQFQVAKIRELEAELAEALKEIELAYDTLALFGVPKKRARSLTNGIGVLVCRIDRELTEALRKLANERERCMREDCS